MLDGCIDINIDHFSKEAHSLESTQIKLPYVVFDHNSGKFDTFQLIDQSKTISGIVYQRQTHNKARTYVGHW